MQHSEFITAIEECYGEYNSDMLKTMVLKFILEKFKEEQLEEIFKKILLSIPTKFKTPPGIAEINDLFFSAKNIEAEAVKWWNLVNTGDAWRDAVISDIRAQACIQDMGGWATFQTRFVKDKDGRDIDQWTRKQFINLFKMYSEFPPKREFKIMRGLSENDNRRPMFIGDKSVCKSLLAEQKNNPVNKAIENMAEKFKVKEEV